MNIELYKEVKKLADWASDFLKLKVQPTIIPQRTEKFVKEQQSFGGYEPGEKRIYLVTENRNLADILRSLSHELVHAKQDEEGRLTLEDGKTGSEIENQANSVAGIMMRKYGKENPHIYTMFSNLEKQEVAEGLLDTNKTYPFKKEGGENHEYTFDTEENNYRVKFRDMEGGYYEKSYDIEGDYKAPDKNQTMENKALKVMSTVTAITVDFLKNPPSDFYTLIIHPIDSRRLRISKALLEKTLPETFIMTEEDGGILQIKRKK